MEAIVQGWPGLAGTDFTRGVDSAAQVPGGGSGGTGIASVYLFWGGAYVRYHVSDERIVSGPMSARRAGPGWSAPASLSITAWEEVDEKRHRCWASGVSGLLRRSSHGRGRLSGTRGFLAVHGCVFGGEPGAEVVDEHPQHRRIG